MLLQKKSYNHVSLTRAFYIRPYTSTSHVWTPGIRSVRYLTFWYLVCVFGRINCVKAQIVFPYWNWLKKLLKVLRQTNSHWIFRLVLHNYPETMRWLCKGLKYFSKKKLGSRKLGPWFLNRAYRHTLVLEVEENCMSSLALSKALGEGFSCFPGRDWEGVCWKLLPLVKLYQTFWI